jgi:hypothetical protein
MNQKIIDLFINTLKLNVVQFSSLIGEREEGSQWGEEITREQLEGMDWKEVPVDGRKAMLPFCKYYRALLPDNTPATQRAEMSSKVTGIEVQEAVHTDKDRGTRVHELVSRNIKPRSCVEAWLVEGPACDENNNPIEGETIIWCVYPGELMASLPPDWDGNLDSLDMNDDYTVKGI